MNKTLHSPQSQVEAPILVSAHRGTDDLLSAGLGLAGLRSQQPPAFANSRKPTPAELRRRAIWSSWRGIADLSPSGGYGRLYGALESVPGREYSSLATLPGARHPHRVLAQVPDDFDHDKRCLVVSAASGSRGVYGAIAVGAAWGLPRGCAVVHTDKGAGSDYFDLDAGLGIGLDGRLVTAGEAPVFLPAPASGQGVAFKHAHSGDHPESDWGRHVQQAAAFGLQALNLAFPEAAPFTFDNTRVIATGISNGGGAVLRAAELEGDWLDGVVAGAPNIYLPAPGARTLYDYASEAALLMPCALPALGLSAPDNGEALCKRLAAQGVLQGQTLAEQQRSALASLKAAGWEEAALIAAASSTGLDMWRALLVTYASAYTGSGHDAHPCGFRFVLGDAAARASWWSDASGIPPGSGVQIVDPAAPEDLGITGLECLRALWTGDSAIAQRLQQGVAETHAALPRPGLPVMVVHGKSDGLIPQAFSAVPYVRAARNSGCEVRLWQVENAQHFDAFLALPQFATQYVPLLPYVYAALDRLDAYLDGKAALPADAEIAARPRGEGKDLSVADLAMPG
ncbi:hydrogenase [Lysobacteraceae bacterium NML71-0210]|nr:hydrogenase [Xanthomonadaceae bacterium NML71-0210]